MKKHISTLALVAINLVNITWLALNIHSSSYLHVPRKFVKLKPDGEVYINDAWLNGGNFYIFLLSAVLALTALLTSHFSSERRDKRKVNTEQ